MTESSEYIVQQVITNSTYSIESHVHLAGDHNCRQNQLSGNPDALSSLTKLVQALTFYSQKRITFLNSQVLNQTFNPVFTH